MKNYIYLFIFGLLMFLLTFVVAGQFFEKNKKEFVSEELEKARVFRELSNNIKETVSQDEKIGAKAKLTIEKIYKKCGHIEECQDTVDKHMVNLTEKEFEKKYSSYSISSFSKDEIRVEELVEGICPNHYKISLGEDFIEVFKMISSDQDELYWVTNISKDYLAQSDIESLREGIEVYGRENINSKLEDYE